MLAGDAEPGGRLPFAVPTDADHLPEFDRDATAVTYGLFHGQWKLDHDGHVAHFPFGWGLGYGAVTVLDASLSDPTTLVASVHNAGDHATSSVVFVHAGLERSDWDRPSRRLVGFARVRVEPGMSVDVEIELDWSMLDVRVGGDWHTEHGVHRLDVGLHANDPAAVTVAVDR
jgi:beta-glucosidase